MSHGEQLAIRMTLAEVEDVPEILRSMRASADAPHWPAEALHRLLESGEGEGRQSTLFAMRSGDGAVCGWLAGTVVAEVAELEFLLVEPAFRGMGLGGRLVDQWLRWAAERGASEALLEVRASNAAALALYRRHGFREQGRRRGYYRDPIEDAVLMSRALAGKAAEPVCDGQHS